MKIIIHVLTAALLFLSPNISGTRTQYLMCLCMNFTTRYYNDILCRISQGRCGKVCIPRLLSIYALYCVVHMKEIYQVQYWVLVRSMNPKIYDVQYTVHQARRK
jgi:hypothetical protein